MFFLKILYHSLRGTQKSSPELVESVAKKLSFVELFDFDGNEDCFGEFVVCFCYDSFGCFL